VIGLDSNVLVRYIMQDDAKQSALATRIVESLTVDSPGFVALVAVVELAWVLSSAYELSRSQLIEAFEALLRTKELVVERGESIWKGLRLLQRFGGDFADCLIACSAEAAGCKRTMTFDRGAAKSGAMTLVS
jgi:predicted nucleic-acid-binding protein